MLDYVIIEARRQPQNEIVLTKRIARNLRISVGRTDAADLVLNDDPEISSVHFLIEVGEQDCIVTDQNSTNKTWHNGCPITQIGIGDGESIRCGKTEITFRLIAANNDRFSAPPKDSGHRKTESGFNRAPDPATASELSPQSLPLPAEPPAPSPSPSQPAPVRQPAQPAKKPPSPAKQPPSPGSPPKVAASPVSTDSEELINWGLFAEQKPEPQQSRNEPPREKRPARAAKADRQSPVPEFVEGWIEEQGTDASEKTQVVAGQIAPVAIVRVVISIVGIADPSAQLAIDPARNSKVVIGRGNSSQLSCPSDPFMSCRQFEIEIIGNQCLIRDLKSSNGTLLNGQRVLLAPLCHGDLVRAGTTDFEVTIETRD